MYVYFYSIRVSDSCVHHQENELYQYDIWYTSICVDDRLVCRFGWSSIQTCIPDGHLHRVTYTRCRTDTTDSPDDGHITVRNVRRIKINIHEKELCVKLVIYKDYNRMHGQQNIKLSCIFWVTAILI